MSKIFLLDPEQTIDNQQAGGKAVGLHTILKAGYLVPKTVCIPSHVYDLFLDHHGIREKIALTLNRKPQEKMRWEEIWDTALRIKSLFHTASIPRHLANELSLFLQDTFGDALVAVRSSATDEDQKGGSFAGLHQSYLNISGEEILNHVKKVWASLWSDRALLYRQELGLSVENSNMAVIVQEMLPSDVSGVCFTHDPMGSNAVVVEAVYGLNQGLVDGQIQPDRWFLERTKNRIKQWKAPENRSHKINARSGVSVLECIAESKQAQPPLGEKELFELKKRCLQLSSHFNQPLDIEWTICNGRCYFLQARPISTLSDPDGTDQRPWYLSLHRSYDNLIQLQQTIENDVLPAMDREALRFEQIDPEQLDDHALAQMITHRMARNEHWTDVYWKQCIPFAHGVRLFGEIYNELLTPDDPYEFVQLLSYQNMLSTHRNQQLQDLATMVKQNPVLANKLEQFDGTMPDDPLFRKSFERLLSQFGFLFPGLEEDASQRRQIVISVIREYTKLQIGAQKKDQSELSAMKQRFLVQMDKTQYPFSGKDLLNLARASYRIRDDDNIYLGKIELQTKAAINAGRKRLAARGISGWDRASPQEITAVLTGHQQGLSPAPAKRSSPDTPLPSRVRARQLLGQPAARGIARGTARVILQPEDLKKFRKGEILIVDSIDPNMTFIAPLAAAIVERRGGMLIHGAIIAREYGIPCITGIPDATRLIDSGDTIMVDGYLGLVTIDKKPN